ncbi:MAG: hypothetical protein HZC17_07565 [Candidatus Omnitrophica bacterium]|nr:hypothetical protein [Candidatus Omnitrophota bacterium]
MEVINLERGRSRQALKDQSAQLAQIADAFARVMNERHIPLAILSFLLDQSDALMTNADVQRNIPLAQEGPGEAYRFNVLRVIAAVDELAGNNRKIDIRHVFDSILGNTGESAVNAEKNRLDEAWLREELERRKIFFSDILNVKLHRVGIDVHPKLFDQLVRQQISGYNEPPYTRHPKIDVTLRMLDRAAEIVNQAKANNVYIDPLVLLVLLDEASVENGGFGRQSTISTFAPVFRDAKMNVQRLSLARRAEAGGLFQAAGEEQGRYDRELQNVLQAARGEMSQLSPVDREVIRGYLLAATAPAAEGMQKNINDRYARLKNLLNDGALSTQIGKNAAHQALLEEFAQYFVEDGIDSQTGLPLNNVYVTSRGEKIYEGNVQYSSPSDIGLYLQFISLVASGKVNVAGLSQNQAAGYLAKAISTLEKAPKWNGLLPWLTIQNGQVSDMNHAVSLVDNGLLTLGLVSAFGATKDQNGALAARIKALIDGQKLGYQKMIDPTTKKFYGVINTQSGRPKDGYYIDTAADEHTAIVPVLVQLYGLDADVWNNLRLGAVKDQINGRNVMIQTTWGTTLQNLQGSLAFSDQILGPAIQQSQLNYALYADAFSQNYGLPGPLMDSASPGSPAGNQLSARPETSYVVKGIPSVAAETIREGMHRQADPSASSPAAAALVYGVNPDLGLKEFQRFIANPMIIGAMGFSDAVDHQGGTTGRRYAVNAGMAVLGLSRPQANEAFQTGLEGLTNNKDVTKQIGAMLETKTKSLDIQPISGKSLGAEIVRPGEIGQLPVMGKSLGVAYKPIEHIETRAPPAKERAKAGFWSLAVGTNYFTRTFITLAAVIITAYLIYSGLGLLFPHVFGASFFQTILAVPFTEIQAVIGGLSWTSPFSVLSSLTKVEILTPILKVSLGVVIVGAQAGFSFGLARSIVALITKYTALGLRYATGKELPEHLTEREHIKQDILAWLKTEPGRLFHATVAGIKIATFLALAVSFGLGMSSFQLFTYTPNIALAAKGLQLGMAAMLGLIGLANFGFKFTIHTTHAEKFNIKVLWNWRVGILLALGGLTGFATGYLGFVFATYWLEAFAFAYIFYSLPASIIDFGAKIVQGLWRIIFSPWIKHVYETDPEKHIGKLQGVGLTALWLTTVGLTFGAFILAAYLSSIALIVSVPVTLSVMLPLAVLLSTGMIKWASVKTKEVSEDWFKTIQLEYREFKIAFLTGLANVFVQFALTGCVTVLYSMVTVSGESTNLLASALAAILYKFLNKAVIELQLMQNIQLGRIFVAHALPAGIMAAIGGTAIPWFYYFITAFGAGVSWWTAAKVAWSTPVLLFGMSPLAFFFWAIAVGFIIQKYVWSLPRDWDEETTMKSKELVKRIDPSQTTVFLVNSILSQLEEITGGHIGIVWRSFWNNFLRDKKGNFDLRDQVIFLFAHDNEADGGVAKPPVVRDMFNFLMGRQYLGKERMIMSFRSRSKDNFANRNGARNSKWIGYQEVMSWLYSNVNYIMNYLTKKSDLRRQVRIRRDVAKLLAAAAIQDPEKYKDLKQVKAFLQLAAQKDPGSVIFEHDPSRADLGTKDQLRRDEDYISYIELINNQGYAREQFNMDLFPGGEAFPTPLRLFDVTFDDHIYFNVIDPSGKFPVKRFRMTNGGRIFDEAGKLVADGEEWVMDEEGYLRQKVGAPGVLTYEYQGKELAIPRLQMDFQTRIVAQRATRDGQLVNKKDDNNNILPEEFLMTRDGDILDSKNNVVGTTRTIKVDRGKGNPADIEVRYQDVKYPGMDLTHRLADDLRSADEMVVALERTGKLESEIRKAHGLPLEKDHPWAVGIDGRAVPTNLMRWLHPDALKLLEERARLVAKKNADGSWNIQEVINGDVAQLRPISPENIKSVYGVNTVNPAERTTEKVAEYSGYWQKSGTIPDAYEFIKTDWPELTGFIAASEAASEDVQGNLVANVLTFKNSSESDGVLISDNYIRLADGSIIANEVVAQEGEYRVRADGKAELNSGAVLEKEIYTILPDNKLVLKHVLAAPGEYVWDDAAPQTAKLKEGIILARKDTFRKDALDHNYYRHVGVTTDEVNQAQREGAIGDQALLNRGKTGFEELFDVDGNRAFYLQKVYVDYANQRGGLFKPRQSAITQDILLGLKGSYKSVGGVYKLRKKLLDRDQYIVEGNGDIRVLTMPAFLREDGNHFETRDGVLYLNNNEYVMDAVGNLWSKNHVSDEASDEFVGAAGTETVALVREEETRDVNLHVNNAVIPYGMSLLPDWKTEGTLNDVAKNEQGTRRFPKLRVQYITQTDPEEEWLPRTIYATVARFTRKKTDHPRPIVSLAQWDIAIANRDRNLHLAEQGFAQHVLRYVARGKDWLFKEAIAFGKMAFASGLYMANVAMKQAVEFIARCHDHWEALHGLGRLWSSLPEHGKMAIIGDNPDDFPDFIRRGKGWIPGDIYLHFFDTTFGAFIKFIRGDNAGALKQLGDHTSLIQTAMDHIRNEDWVDAGETLKRVHEDRKRLREGMKNYMSIMVAGIVSMQFFMLWLLGIGLPALIIPGFMTAAHPIISAWLFGGLMFVMLTVSKFIVAWVESLFMTPEYQNPSWWPKWLPAFNDVIQVAAPVSKFLIFGGTVMATIFCAVTGLWSSVIVFGVGGYLLYKAAEALWIKMKTQSTARTIAMLTGAAAAAGLLYFFGSDIMLGMKHMIGSGITYVFVDGFGLPLERVAKFKMYVHAAVQNMSPVKMITEFIPSLIDEFGESVVKANSAAHYLVALASALLRYVLPYGLTALAFLFLPKRVWNSLSLQFDRRILDQGLKFPADHPVRIFFNTGIFDFNYLSLKLFMWMNLETVLTTAKLLNWGHFVNDATAKGIGQVLRMIAAGWKPAGDIKAESKAEKKEGESTWKSVIGKTPPVLRIVGTVVYVLGVTAWSASFLLAGVFPAYFLVFKFAGLALLAFSLFIVHRSKSSVMTLEAPWWLGSRPYLSTFLIIGLVTAFGWDTALIWKGWPIIIWSWGMGGFVSLFSSRTGLSRYFRENAFLGQADRLEEWLKWSAPFEDKTGGKREIKDERVLEKIKELQLVALPAGKVTEPAWKKEAVLSGTEKAKLFLRHLTTIRLTPEALDAAALKYFEGEIGGTREDGSQGLQIRRRTYELVDSPREVDWNTLSELRRFEILNDIYKTGRGKDMLARALKGENGKPLVSREALEKRMNQMRAVYELSMRQEVFEKKYPIYQDKVKLVISKLKEYNVENINGLVEAGDYSSALKILNKYLELMNIEHQADYKTDVNFDKNPQLKPIYVSLVDITNQQLLFGNLRVPNPGTNAEYSGLAMAVRDISKLFAAPGVVFGHLKRNWYELSYEEKLAKVRTALQKYDAFLNLNENEREQVVTFLVTLLGLSLQREIAHAGITMTDQPISSIQRKPSDFLNDAQFTLVNQYLLNRPVQNNETSYQLAKSMTGLLDRVKLNVPLRYSWILVGSVLAGIVTGVIFGVFPGIALGIGGFVVAAWISSAVWGHSFSLVLRNMVLLLTPFFPKWDWNALSYREKIRTVLDYYSRYKPEITREHNFEDLYDHDYSLRSLIQLMNLAIPKNGDPHRKGEDPLTAAIVESVIWKQELAKHQENEIVSRQGDEMNTRTTEAVEKILKRIYRGYIPHFFPSWENMSFRDRRHFVEGVIRKHRLDLEHQERVLSYFDLFREPKGRAMEAPPSGPAQPPAGPTAGPTALGNVLTPEVAPAVQPTVPVPIPGAVPTAEEPVAPLLSTGDSGAWLLEESGQIALPALVTPTVAPPAVSEEGEEPGTVTRIFDKAEMEGKVAGRPEETFMTGLSERKVTEGPFEAGKETMAELPVPSYVQPSSTPAPLGLEKPPVNKKLMDDLKNMDNAARRNRFDDLSEDEMKSLLEGDQMTREYFDEFLKTILIEKQLTDISKLISLEAAKKLGLIQELPVPTVTGLMKELETASAESGERRGIFEDSLSTDLGKNMLESDALTREYFDRVLKPILDSDDLKIIYQLISSGAVQKLGLSVPPPAGTVEGQSLGRAHEAREALLDGLHSIEGFKGQYAWARLEAALGDNRVNILTNAFNQAIDRAAQKNGWVATKSFEVIDYNSGLGNILSRDMMAPGVTLTLANVPEDVKVPEGVIKSKDSIAKIVADLKLKDPNVNISIVSEKDTELSSMPNLYQVVYDKQALEAYDGARSLVVLAGRDIARFGEVFAGEAGIIGSGVSGRTYIFGEDAIRSLLENFVKTQLAARAVQAAA